MSREFSPLENLICPFIIFGMFIGFILAIQIIFFKELLQDIIIYDIFLWLSATLIMFAIAESHDRRNDALEQTSEVQE